MPLTTEIEKALRSLRKYKVAVVFCGCFLFVSPAITQESQGPLRLVHADLLKRETVGSRVLQKLVGNVEFKQGQTIIVCDLAEQLVQKKQYALIGHVRISDEEQVLLADTVYIYQELKKEVATGHVVRWSEQDTTSADKMTFFREEDRFLSEGSVEIINVSDRSRIIGGRALYLRAEDFGEITESPMLFLYDSLDVETTSISADTLKIFGGGKHTVAIGNVRITQKEVVATCGRADFFKDEDRIFLFQQPEVQHAEQTIAGDSLELFLANSLLDHAVVTGNASVVSDADSLNRGQWQNRSTGQRMEFLFDDDKIEKVLISGQATSVYHVFEDGVHSGENAISGDEITIQFLNGAITNVLVKSTPDVAEGKFSPGF